MTLSRRIFLQQSAAGLVCSRSSLLAQVKPAIPENQLLDVGATTSSFSGHLTTKSTKGKFTLLELPRIMRGELDMKVIDLNTSSLASFEPSYLEKVRKAVDQAGCVLTNLKMNQRGLDMNSANRAVREKALAEYQRSIDAAAHLGLRWARPLPLKARPNMKQHVASYQVLADYAAKKKVQMLVENYGWMESDPDSVVRLVKAVGRNVAACPDTGNWSDNTVRYAGLEKTFPLAVTCDFKARKLTADGKHPLYDLERCFRIGWKAGFRGPWCLEHANPNQTMLFKELALLSERLRMWMKAE